MTHTQTAHLKLFKSIATNLHLFVFVVVIFVAFFSYMYPRYFLTSHFWTLQQKSEFAVMNLRDRLSHNRPVFRAIQSKLSSLKNDRHYDQWAEILGKLGSGVHPTVDEILSVKELFAEAPYKTSSLNYAHIVSKFIFSMRNFYKNLVNLL